MKYSICNVFGLFRPFAVILSKLVLCVLAVFSTMLFAAVAEGGIHPLIGLGLGVLILLAANVFCGIVLPAEGSAPGVAPVQSQAMHRTTVQPAPVVPLRVVRGGHAA